MQTALQSHLDELDRSSKAILAAVTDAGCARLIKHPEMRLFWASRLKGLLRADADDFLAQVSVYISSGTICA